MEDLTGRQFGPYQIVAPLGEGGMAAVYKAYQPGMDRYVALKILPRQYSNDPTFIKRFEREAKIIANLQHINILPVHDYGETDGYTYIVMRLVETGTLADLLKGAPLPLPQIQQIISQIGDALDYAHDSGVIHRDIKPSNILVDEQGNCLLADFGIGKVLEETVHLTSTGGIVGTPAYMSPDQGFGKDIDKRSDIYSLGIILYEMVIGRPPFNAETPLAIMVKHMNDPLPPPRVVKPSISEPLERVILKSLAKDREQRYSSAREMVNALKIVSEHIQPVDAETLKIDQLSKEVKTLISNNQWVQARTKIVQLQGLGPDGQTRASDYKRKIPKIWLRIPRWIWLVVISVILIGVIFALVINNNNPSNNLEVTQTVLVIQQTQTSIAAHVSPINSIIPSVTSQTKSTLQPTDTLMLPSKTPKTISVDGQPTYTPWITKTPYIARVTLTASQNMFCRDGPGSYYEDHTMVMAGETVPVNGKWHENWNWLLVEINKTDTRTKCCWVGGEGNTNVNLSNIPTIDYLVDRITCKRK